jgi:hypothetical protein
MRPRRRASTTMGRRSATSSGLNAGQVVQRPQRAAYDQAAQSCDLSGRQRRPVQHDRLGIGLLRQNVFDTLMRTLAGLKSPSSKRLRAVWCDIVTAIEIFDEARCFINYASRRGEGKIEARYKTASHKINLYDIKRRSLAGGQNARRTETHHQKGTRPGV